ncbi:MAG: hypothetical protein AABZ14_05540, partial [Candidatus Margulisiibacteriota bacterium]
ELRDNQIVNDQGYISINKEPSAGKTISLSFKNRDLPNGTIIIPKPPLENKSDLPTSLSPAGLLVTLPLPLDKSVTVETNGTSESKTPDKNKQILLPDGLPGEQFKIKISSNQEYSVVWPEKRPLREKGKCEKKPEFMEEIINLSTIESDKLLDEKISDPKVLTDIGDIMLKGYKEQIEIQCSNLTSLNELKKDENCYQYAVGKVCEWYSPELEQKLTPNDTQEKIIEIIEEKMKDSAVLARIKEEILTQMYEQARTSCSVATSSLEELKKKEELYKNVKERVYFMYLEEISRALDSKMTEAIKSLPGGDLLPLLIRAYKDSSVQGIEIEVADPRLVNDVIDKLKLIPGIKSFQNDQFECDGIGFVKVIPYVKKDGSSFQQDIAAEIRNELVSFWVDDQVVTLSHQNIKDLILKAYPGTSLVPIGGGDPDSTSHLTVTNYHGRVDGQGYDLLLQAIMKMASMAPGYYRFYEPTDGSINSKILGALPELYKKVNDMPPLPILYLVGKGEKMGNPKIVEVSSKNTTNTLDEMADVLIKIPMKNDQQYPYLLPENKQNKNAVKEAIAKFSWDYKSDIEGEQKQPAPMDQAEINQPLKDATLNRETVADINSHIRQARTMGNDDEALRWTIILRYMKQCNQKEISQSYQIQIEPISAKALEVMRKYVPKEEVTFSYQGDKQETNLFLKGIGAIVGVVEPPTQSPPPPDLPSIFPVETYKQLAIYRAFMESSEEGKAILKQRTAEFQTGSKTITNPDYAKHLMFQNEDANEFATWILDTFLPASEDVNWIFKAQSLLTSLGADEEFQLPTGGKIKLSELLTKLKGMTHDVDSLLSWAGVNSDVRERLKEQGFITNDANPRILKVPTKTEWTDLAGALNFDDIFMKRYLFQSGMSLLMNLIPMTHEGVVNPNPVSPRENTALSQVEQLFLGRIEPDHIGARLKEAILSKTNNYDREKGLHEMMMRLQPWHSVHASQGSG